MGADFIEKATPTFKKSWDRARVALATADLFTREPTCAARTAAAEIIGNARLRAGEQLTVEREGEGLVALRGNSEVARFTKPAPELVKAVRDSCGVAKGVVDQVHDLAGVAEISLC
ncbi:hypothetical protein IHQ68_17895 [Chelatococcus sambhunathii]|uniref:BON domain n=1 Tax=Chelatococcus sambhunathii TaxID=363953 RepID=A0ABU1DKT8_9HYPH|nr:hypothetical protein [Chelatococcus sambhunathii]MDR4308495.1 hypothetical protein [Chelatococcus sambhunathii]